MVGLYTREGFHESFDCPIKVSVFLFKKKSSIKYCTVVMLKERLETNISKIWIAAVISCGTVVAIRHEVRLCTWFYVGGDPST